MKIRNGFVSNSSSSSYIVENRSNKMKTIVDFVKGHPNINEYSTIVYGNEDYSFKDALHDAESMLSKKKEDFIVVPNEAKKWFLSDHGGGGDTVLEWILCYYFTDGYHDDNWKVNFYESYR